MPILSSHGNFSAKGFGVAVGKPRLEIVTNPAPASVRRVYTSGGVDYFSLEITSTATLVVNGPAGISYPVDIFMIGGGGSGVGSPGIGSSGPGGSGGAYSVTSVSLTGGSPVPIVVGGAGSISSVGSSPSSVTASGGGGTAFPSPLPINGQPGVSNNYATGSPITYGGGGGGGNPNSGGGGAGGAGGGGPGGGGAQVPGSPGGTNTGGGGGGGGSGNLLGPIKSGTFVAASGGSGGPGIVVIRGPRELFF